MKYEEPAHLPHGEAERVLEESLAGAATPYANEVLIGLALFDDDQDFVESWCRRIGRDAADSELRGSAALSAGHLARRFGTLAPETQAMVRAVAADPSVDGRKYDALEDMEQFLGRHS